MHDLQSQRVCFLYDHIDFAPFSLRLVAGGIPRLVAGGIPRQGNSHDFFALQALPLHQHPKSLPSQAHDLQAMRVGAKCNNMLAVCRELYLVGVTPSVVVLGVLVETDMCGKDGEMVSIQVSIL